MFGNRLALSVSVKKRSLGWTAHLSLLEPGYGCPRGVSSQPAAPLVCGEPLALLDSPLDSLGAGYGCPQGGFVLASGAGGLWSGLGDCRQLQGEQRAALRFVVAGDLATVILHDAVGSAESEPRAFADRLGGIERIENTLRIANAGTCIGKLHHHVGFLALGEDLQQAAGCAHGIHGIFDD